jgi:hypothetical protein
LKKITYEQGQNHSDAIFRATREDEISAAKTIIPESHLSQSLEIQKKDQFQKEF